MSATVGTFTSSRLLSPGARGSSRAAVVCSTRSTYWAPRRVLARRNNNARRLSAVRANGTDSVDWDAKTKEMTAERIMERCLEAMAEGDEEQLASCLLELEEPEEKSTVIESLMTKKKEDEFWTKKLQEIAAERVLENCMSAVMNGDVDDIDACMLDAQNDTLLGVDFTTAEDGTKTFRF